MLGRRAISRSSSPATPTCSAPSPCCSRTICSPTSKCSRAIRAGWPTAPRAPTSCRSAPAPSRAARCRSTVPSSRKELGFARVSENSMDAVSDRDFIVEYHAACALLAVHLSRLAEDLILWSTAEFGFIRIGDAYTTGSSLMPQKKNPDIAELARGKSARVIGNLVALAHAAQGPADDLQSRSAGGQGSALRHRAHGAVHAADFRRNARRHRRRPRRPAHAPRPIRSCSPPTSPTGSCARACPSARRIISSARRSRLAESRKVPIIELDLADWKKISPVFDRQRAGRLLAGAGTRTRVPRTARRIPSS